VVKNAYIWKCGEGKLNVKMIRGDIVKKKKVKRQRGYFHREAKSRNTMSRVGLGEDLFGRVEEWPLMLSVEIDTSLGHLSHMFVSNRRHDNDTSVKDWFLS